METPKNLHICDRDLPEALLTAYLQSPNLAVDTETMGLIPRRDRLCLVQLCDPQGQVTVLRIAQGQTAAPNLKQLLEAPAINKVFHYARFDVGILNYQLGIHVHPIFCTKIASKLGRTYTNRHGLKELVQDLQKVELDKSSQSSDWGNAAGLSTAQLDYAANDVRYLLPVQETLTTMLQREGRWDLAQDCFRCVPTLVQLDLRQYNNVFEH